MPRYPDPSRKPLKIIPPAPMPEETTTPSTEPDKDLRDKES